MNDGDVASPVTFDHDEASTRLWGPIGRPPPLEEEAITGDSPRGMANPPRAFHGECAIRESRRARLAHRKLIESFAESLLDSSEGQ